MSANIANHRVVRPYTPISPGDTKGHFDLLVKVYFPQEGRPGGLMSTYLDSLHPGATVHVRGPLVRAAPAQYSSSCADGLLPCCTRFFARIRITHACARQHGICPCEMR